jgi:hypothetical protein
MNEIFVIVENVDYEEGLVVREGYFTDEHSAEKRVDEMNEHHLAQVKKEMDRDGTDYDLEDEETHYGFIPLSMNSRNRG